MSEVLVLVEHAGGDVKKVTHELLTLARTLGEPAAVVVGDVSDKLVDALACWRRRRCTWRSGAEFATTSSPRTSPHCRPRSGVQSAGLLVASTAEGKEIAGRLAVRLGSGVITDAVGVGDGLVAEQSVFGGSTLVHSKVTTGAPIIAVRPNSVPAEQSAGAGKRVDLTVSVTMRTGATKVTERVAGEGRTPRAHRGGHRRVRWSRRRFSRGIRSRRGTR